MYNILSSSYNMLSKNIFVRTLKFIASSFGEFSIRFRDPRKESFINLLYLFYLLRLLFINHKFCATYLDSAI